MYIYQYKNWPIFDWDAVAVSVSLGRVRNKQGRLAGYMQTLGFSLKEQAMADTLSLDILKSSEIEGEFLDAEQVRSSIARHLGMDISGLIPSDRNVDGIVEMMLDATQNSHKPLTKNRLFDWHAALFPTGRSGMYKIQVAEWRDDSKGPMQVVSGPMGRERVHFQAPEPKVLEKEMKRFIEWYNNEQSTDTVIKAAIAHLWFITIHPFDDGNGRVARAITDMALSASEEGQQRYYSMSAEIRKRRKAYYDILENTQKGNLDITGWIAWFLTCLEASLDATEQTLIHVLQKARFWEKHNEQIINERQRLMVNKMFDGFDGKLTSSKWAKITKCSSDTALRDIQDLMNKKMLKKDEAGGRNTNYLLDLSE